MTSTPEAIAKQLERDHLYGALEGFTYEQRGKVQMIFYRAMLQALQLQREADAKVYEELARGKKYMGTLALACAAAIRGGKP